MAQWLSLHASTAGCTSLIPGRETKTLRVSCSTFSFLSAPVHAQLLQLYLILCDSMDCSPLDSSAHGIFQQECQSGLPCPPLGGLPHPRMEPTGPELAVEFFTTESAGKPPPFFFPVVWNNLKKIGILVL